MSTQFQMAAGHCTGCGEYAFVGPLHGSDGGRLVCVKCKLAFDQQREVERKKHQRIIDAFGFGRSTASDGELYLELLEDAIRLTHPDRHPEERAALAQRVTAELLALKPFVKPRPPKVSDGLNLVRTPTLRQIVTGRDGFESTHRGTPLELSRGDFPCSQCRREVPADYCDGCKLVSDLNWLFRTAKERAAAKRRRAWKRFCKPARACASCGAKFKARKDKKFCSHACRQRAYRVRSDCKVEGAA